MTTDAGRSSFFIALVVADIFVGLADSISLPYMVLFFVDQAGMSPLSLSAILTARALSSIVFSMAFGAWIDKRTSVAPLLLALAGSAAGYGLLGLTKDFVALLVIAALPVAIGAAAFSQSIALAKRNFNQASPHTVNRAIGVLRASWSLAWAIGPAVGALLISAAGFRGAFFGSAASGAIALVTLAVVQRGVLLDDAGTPIGRSSRMEAQRSRSLSRRLPCFTPPCSWARSRFRSCSRRRWAARKATSASR